MKQGALAVLILIGLAAPACQSNPTPSPSSAPSGEILIASDFPMSGQYEPDAVQVQQAIKLALDQHPTIGKYRLAYWPLDDDVAGDPNPARGRENVKRMVSEARVLAMIGPYTSAPAFEEIPVASAANLVMLSPSNTDACLTKPAAKCDPQPIALRQGQPNNYFRVAPPDPVQGRAMAKFATGTLKIQRVAVFNEWGIGGDQIMESFAMELALTGGSLVLQRELVSGTTDFSDFLSAASTAHAQAIYALGHVSQGICAARAQMTSKLFPDGAYFLATDGTTREPKCVTQAADKTAGIYATLPDVDATLSSDAAAMKVVADYRKAYPKTEPSASYIFAAYDCALIVIEAITRAIDAAGGAIPTRAQVLAEVAKGTFKNGITGTYSFDASGDAVSPLMSMYKVQDGKWVYIDRIDASS
jgi:branched-chain amino acid transport system substrate-binding protein